VPQDSETLSDCYYIAGDVCDFIAAPKAAIAYYKKALEFNSENCAAHREIARMYWQMGAHSKTIEHSDKALEKWPDDKHALEDRVDFDAERAEAFEPYIEGNPIWRSIEFLAIGEPEKALEFAKKDRSVEGKRVLTHCYGALGDSENYLKSWQNLCGELGVLDFSYADWFFFDDEEHDRPEIWEIWLNSGLKFTGVFHEFLPLVKNKKFASLGTHECLEVCMEFFYYSNSKNTKELDRLKAIYPEFSKME